MNDLADQAGRHNERPGLPWLPDSAERSEQILLLCQQKSRAGRARTSVICFAKS